MLKKQISEQVKEFVRSRANGLCEYCLAIFAISYATFPVDHIIPESKGGSDGPDNLANTCQNCNNSKYNKTEWIDWLSGEVVRLFNPRTDVWSEHFEWNDDFTILTGRTPIGRATVNCLRINRPRIVKLRLFFFKLGIHPAK